MLDGTLLIGQEQERRVHAPRDREFTPGAAKGPVSPRLRAMAGTACLCSPPTRLVKEAGLEQETLMKLRGASLLGHLHGDVDEVVVDAGPSPMRCIGREASCRVPGAGRASL